MTISRLLFAAGSLLLAATLARGQSGNDACAKLASLQIPNVTITSAKAFPTGTYNAPSGNGGADVAAFYSKLAAFCRVMAKAAPSADSDIAIEIWMPLEGWNGRFQGTGNGGFAGSYDTGELAEFVSKGYAAAATDTGHTGSFIDASWAIGHPEKVIDFGYRGIHEMTRVAKLVVAQFYGSGASHSYFASCSDGGREALMEAQRFPDDYDGILAGAPANNWTLLLTGTVTDTLALTASPESFIPPKKIATIAHAVLAQCDALDGVSDGILNDPRQCEFDPASIECKNGEDTGQCLTGPQVTSLKAIYGGVKDEHGRTLFPGYLPGAEEGQNGWGTWITGPAPGRSLMAAFGSGYYSDMVYQKSDWDMKSFSLETGLPLAAEKTAHALNSTDPNLKPFYSHGGKLIIYHGWNDPAIPALSTVNYYQSVIDKLGQGKSQSFVRLYMVPGMQHCAGGPGPDEFGQSPSSNPDPHYNARTALELWVEKGTAPSSIIATKTAAAPPGAGNSQAAPAITRPLCPFPQVAQYKGSGDTNSAENFGCAAPKK
ncbi:MAG: tannase/feruloyl esterase family alpha/beta hydrolase [Terracidiphilus sp.]|jgi:feruloyl esterase